MKTKTQQKLEELNQILATNKTMFEAGNVISRNDLAKLFGLSITTKGSYAKVHRSNLQLVRLQNKLNKLMATNGLCIRSKNYYSEFVVSDENTLKSTIKRMCAYVDRVTDRWVTLETSYTDRKENGNWGRYNKISSKGIKDMSQRQMSFQLKNTVDRVDSF